MNKSKPPYGPGADRLFLGPIRILIVPFLTGLLLLFAGVISAQSTTVPQELPDATAGFVVYQDRCANCHGITGLGDGELAEGLPNPPTAHAAPEYLREAIPVEMFDIVASGRVEMGMPPFGPTSSDPLSDSQRWDVIAAIYSLGTPGDSLEQGSIVYQESCAACHGEQGEGDGPDAADLTTPPPDLNSPDYWGVTSNQTVFDTLADHEVVADHQYDLSEDQLWAVVDYTRSFSYAYFDALSMFQPLESAIIAGQVVNGTTGDTVGAEATALLRGFTQDLQPTLEMEQTLDSGGNFRFDLSDVPQDWFYRIAITYDDLEFGSDFGQLSFQEPELDLPITVFDKTTDPSAVNIEQLHMVLTFGEDRVGVSQLYVVSNGDSRVYVGESGDVDQGVFRFSIPSEAGELSFQRGFGSLDSFIPANEVIPVGDDWADTFPLRPGPGSLTMLVQYTLPYDEGATVNHPINYPTTAVNLVLPDVGVSVEENGDWTDTGQQSMGNSSVATYGRSDLPSGSDLELTLEGKPRQSSTSTGNVIQDNAAELIVGIVAAVVVVIVAVIMIRRWRQEPEESHNRDDLIQAIADLDDEFEAGMIDGQEYHSSREQLMAELRSIWSEDGA